MPDEYVIVEKSTLDSIGDTVRSATGSTENISVNNLNDAVAAAITSGGVLIDSSLTQSGYAADAKATGDAIRSLSEGKVGNLDNLNTQAKENLVAAINEALTQGVDVSGASVGQTIKVAAVDDTGKPTAWEPADLPEQVQPDWEQIDEKVGNLDDLETEAKNNLVDAVNEAMTKGGVTEDYVDNAIQESGYYRQFPFKSIEISKSGGILYFYVNIEDLDDGVQYYLSPSEKEKRKYKELYPNLRLFMVRIYMECDDGTQKQLITGTGPVTYRFRLFTTNKCRLYKSNEALEIDYSDRSTSSAIKTNYIYNSYYLTTGGNAEYIPTTEYSPATKKYVDDEVKAAANSDTPKSHYLLTDSGSGFEYYIKMKNGSLISFCKAEKIEVTTLPTTTEYVAGATLDLTGMVVTLTRQDGTTEEIAGYTTTETVPANGAITVTYVEEDVEYTTTFNVTIEGES